MHPRRQDPEGAGRVKRPHLSLSLNPELPRFHFQCPGRPPTTSLAWTVILCARGNIHFVLDPTNSKAAGYPWAGFPSHSHSLQAPLWTPRKLPLTAPGTSPPQRGSTGHPWALGALCVLQMAGGGYSAGTSLSCAISPLPTYLSLRPVSLSDQVRRGLC